MTNRDAEILFADMIHHLLSGAEVMQCEDGGGKFVSVGAVNGMASSFRRALNDDEYRGFLRGIINAEGGNE